MVHSIAAASRRRGPEPEGPLAASAGNGGKTRDAHAAAAGALDVVGRRLASGTRRPPRADARNRRTARRQPGTPSARRPPRESRRSGTRPTVGPAVNTDYATASTTEPTFTVLAPAVRRPCRASSGYNAQLTNTHDAAADVRHTLTNASDASAVASFAGRAARRHAPTAPPSRRRRRVRESPGARGWRDCQKRRPRRETPRLGGLDYRV